VVHRNPYATAPEVRRNTLGAKNRGLLAGTRPFVETGAAKQSPERQHGAGPAVARQPTRGEARAYSEVRGGATTAAVVLSSAAICIMTSTVLDELLTTEYTYVSQLDAVIAFYLEPFPLQEEVP
jgi:hypothetical protein